MGGIYVASLETGAATKSVFSQKTQYAYEVSFSQ
jgi:hypothetical protein